jgi:hypothetical protein
MMIAAGCSLTGRRLLGFTMRSFLRQGCLPQLTRER